MSGVAGQARSLVAFSALAAFASFQWFELVAGFSQWRWVACVAIAAATGLALLALRPLGIPPLARTATAVSVAVVSLAAGLLACGVPARLLGPTGWGELVAELSGGLAGVSQVELPYAGRAVWTGLGIAVAAPVVLALASAVAFWPARSNPRVRSGIALVLLIALYGVAVTWEAPSAELARGLVLLLLIAGYVWLPRLPWRRAAIGAVAVATAGAVALPAAARVDSSEPLIDYADWNLFGDDEVVSFNWNHSYGPLEWPQRGTELFEVRADRPLYWKTSVLNDFDGAVWTRGGVGNGTVVGSESELAGASDELVASQPQWSERIDLTVSGLRSELLVTAGTTRGIEGVEVEPSDADGITRLPGDGLQKGSSYTLDAYVPEPSAELLRERDDGHYPRGLERYTTLLLPSYRYPAAPLAAEPRDIVVPVATPLRDQARANDPGPSTREVIVGTPYARVLALAKRLTRDAQGNYEAVLAIKRHLLENYRYEQDVPDRPDPLPAFLFRDRAGYCQQFSGAMALMLRMVGVPSRVVSGFAPGLLDDPDDDSFVVRDTDAHSWVEVWFPGVGWVTVDPTPPAAPARAASLDIVLGRSADDGAGGPAFAIEESVGPAPRNGESSPARSQQEQDGPPAWLWIVPAGVGAVTLAFRRRRKRLLSSEGVGLQLAELTRALPRLGYPIGARATLLQMERDLGPRIGPAFARYTRDLRELRYRPGRLSQRPGAVERRAVRRALARGKGPGGRLRALLAIPPGGPGR